MRRLIITLTLLLICVASQADDSAVRGLGGTVAPMKQHPTVRMVSEKVDVKLGWERAEVRCRFVFKNEGAATTVKMGFPEQAWGEVGPITKSGYRHFNSWVDGQRISTKFIPSAKKKYEFPRFDAWYVKDVYFKANQTRIIEDEFDSPYGDTIGDRWFRYILRSGRNWKGSIGKAVITVDASRVWSYWRPEPGKDYPSFTRKGKSIIWRLKNLEPERDIHIDLKPVFTLYLGDPKASRKLDIDDPKLFGKHGIAMVNASNMHQWFWPQMVGRKPSEGVRISYYYDMRSIIIRPESTAALVDGKTQITLPSKPYMKHGHIYVPVLTIAKALGAQIAVNKQQRTIVIKNAPK